MMMMSSINGAMTVISKEHLPALDTVRGMDTMQSDFRVRELNYMTMTDAAKRAEILQGKKELSDTFLAAGKKIEKGFTKQESEKWVEVQKKWGEYLAISDQVVVLFNQGDREKALALLNGKSRETYYALSKDLAEIGKAAREKANQAAITADANYTTTKMISLAVMLTAAVLAAAVGLYISRLIIRSLDGIGARVSLFSKGDFRPYTRKLTSEDEFGNLSKLLTEMCGKVGALLKKISESAEQVAASSEQLTASAQQSAEVTGQVAQSISEVAGASSNQMESIMTTTAAIEEISASIEEVAENAATSAKNANQASDTAQRGTQSVEKAVAQMKTIETTVNHSAEVIGTLGERSKEIGQIVDTISGIAGQTNLLALNAAIEAARAGEHGKGFAVVAEEVRKLAEQSQEAAKQIATLISQIQSETDMAVTAMQEGTREVKVGAEVVDDTGKAFKEIMGLTESVAGQVDGIARTMHEVASGSEQIVNSVKSVDKETKRVTSETQSVSAATQEQSAAMEEIAASSQALAKMAQDLQTEVSRFTV